MRLALVSLRLEKLVEIFKSRKLSRALLEKGVFAGVEHRAVLGSDFSTIVDIGASRGQFALAARYYSPRARIISFEPQPRPARSFRRLFANDTGVTLHETAIGPNRQTQVMHVSRNDDSSSLLPISSTQTGFFPGTHEVGTLDVSVAPLSDFISASDIRPPALLKLDVQGFEYEVLQGAESLLECFAAIYCECSFVSLYVGQKKASDIIRWLEDRNYALDSLHNPYRDATAGVVQADLLFRKKPKKP